MTERTRPAHIRRGLALALLCATLVAPVRAQPVREPAPGVLLVAAEQMGDPRFARSVVLLIEHDQSGSWGLIINKPTDVDPAEVLPSVEADERHAGVYFGGPVRVERVVGLYRDAAAGDHNPAGLPGLYWSDSPEALGVRLQRNPGNVRVFAGYAGWGPGQLRFEIAHGGWRLIQGHQEDVFSDDPARLWQRLDTALEGIAI